MTRLIIPIINTTATLLKGPSHYLDGVTRIDKLSDTEFGLVAKTPAEYSERFRPEHRCIFVDLENDADLESVTSQIATKLRYVLNNFMSEHALLLQFAIFVEKVGKTGQYGKPRAFNLSEDQATLLKSATPFKLRPGTERESISQFYRIIGDACAKYKRLYLTLSRFNSALTRSKVPDKIIDLTISLESMVQDDKNELSFKFAMFNAFAGAKDHTRRTEVFELLKKLYSTRSLIVHGAGDESKEQALVSAIHARWSELEDITRRSINQFIFYAKDNDPKAWTKHLTDKIISSPILIEFAGGKK